MNTNDANRKVAVYARVSTEHEAQLSALENQKDWYKPILDQHPEWDIVHMYVDEGITGTSARKRPQFMQMIQDASSGYFDLIITREVSRFARNTVDTLQYTRDLKSKGVEVYFIGDNIRTFDGDGELRLTIMATLAQDESRKTSMRVKAGQKTSMLNGVYYGSGNILGYDRIDKNNFVINKEQAKTVRMIFDLYIEGNGIRAIQFMLEKAGRTTSAGRTLWYPATISRILQNPFYCGKIVYRKEYVNNYLEQKRMNNFGEVEHIITYGKHDTIVSEEEFEMVQKIFESRRADIKNLNHGEHAKIGIKKHSDVWVDILECECGHTFNRKVWHKYDTHTQYGYQCYSSIKTGSIKTRLNKGLPIDGICAVPMIPGWKLDLIANIVFEKYIGNTVEVILKATDLLDAHIDDKEENDTADIISSKIEEIKLLNRRLDNLIEMRADGDISRDIFLSKKAEIEKSISDAQNYIDSISEEYDYEEDISHEDKIKILKYYLEQSVKSDVNSVISQDVIRAFIKKVIVHKDSFDIYLRFCGNDPDDRSINEVHIDNSLLCSQQHRQLLAKVGASKFVKSMHYSVSKKDAYNYINQHYNIVKLLNWSEFDVYIFI